MHLVRAAQRVVELDVAEDTAGGGARAAQKRAGTPARSVSRVSRRAK